MKTRIQWILLPLWWFIVAGFSTVEPVNAEDADDDELADEAEEEEEEDEDGFIDIQPHHVLQWLQEEFKGFFIHDKVDIDSKYHVNEDEDEEDEDDEEGRRRFYQPQLVATADIAAGETVLVIPGAAILEPNGVDDERLHACDAAWKLLQEFDNEYESTFYPYVTYLLTQPFPAPLASSSEWTVAGQELVQLIVGSELEPQNFGHAYNSSAMRPCQDETAYKEIFHDPLFQKALPKALALVQQHGYDKYLVPLYDMVLQDHVSRANVRHSNERYRKNPWSNLQTKYVLTATRDIVQGEALVMPYHSVGDHFLKHGSLDLDFPQTWWIQSLYDEPSLISTGGMIYDNASRQKNYETFLVFELDKKKKHDDDDYEYSIHWVNNSATIPPHEEQIGWLMSQLRRLSGLSSTIETRVTRELTNATEQVAVTQFYHAYQTALTQAIMWAKHHIEQDDRGEDTAASAPTCVADTEVDTTTVVNGEDDEEHTKGGGDEEEKDEAKKTPLPPRYDSLHNRLDTNIYNERFAGDVCGNPVADTDIYETQKGAYQEMEWAQIVDAKDINHSGDKKFNDTCLLLDGMMHSCFGIRPHVHEAIVHYPVSFMPPGSLKRVLYVGGGDLIILHEIMKYSDSLELVIGMELDQTVLRSSFRNYGVQPQFDDSRVHWWFGDASKSLALLPPEEYFGTFDLVLIDLLVFVFDLLRVQGADGHEYYLVDYMMKLLKPDTGILIRQEDHLERAITDFAKHVVEYDVYGVPYVCQQPFTMGSNGIDFTRAPRYNHGLEEREELVWWDPMLDEGHAHSYIWKGVYLNEVPPARVCKHQVDVAEEVAATPSQDDDASGSPAGATGLLTIVEAENVTVALSNTSLVLTKLGEALAAAGFGPMSFSTHLPAEGHVVLMMVFDEGYLLARTWPQHKYCGLELQLWNGVGKQEDAVAHVLLALGGDLIKSTTSFQITTGGIPTAETDDKQKKESKTKAAAAAAALQPTGCGKKDEQVAESPLEKDEFKVVLEQLVLALSPKVPRPLVVVVCGKNEQDCPVFDTLSYQRQAVKVTSCLDQQPDATEADMVACEAEFLESLRAGIANADVDVGAVDGGHDTRKKFSGVLIDESTPRAMGSVIHKVFNSSLIRNELLAMDYFVLAPLPAPLDTDEKDKTKILRSSWQSNLLERFRAVIIKMNPVVHAMVRFNSQTKDGDSNKGSLHVGMLSCGDTEFYAHLLGALDRIDGQGLTSTVVRSKPGALSPIANYKADRIAKRDDYDFQASTQQWNQQRPVGYQELSQYQIQPTPPLAVGTKIMFNEVVHIFTGVWSAGEIMEVQADGKHYDIKYKSGRRKFVKRDLLMEVTDFMTTDDELPLQFGEPVLLWYNPGKRWFQGMVVEVNVTIDDKKEDDDDVYYKIQRMSDGGHDIVPRKNITRRFDKPSASSSSADAFSMTCLQFSAVWSEILGVLDIKEEAKADDDTESTVTVQKVGNDGCLYVALFQRSSIISAWHGPSGRLTVNLFSLENSKQLQTTIEYYLMNGATTKTIPDLVRFQHDPFPRGHGRVVNWPNDMVNTAWFGCDDPKHYQKKRK